MPPALNWAGVVGAVSRATWRGQPRRSDPAHRLILEHVMPLIFDDEILRRTPLAAGVGVFFCEQPECKRPHVMLFNGDNEPIAHFVVPDPHPDGSGFLSELQNLMYRAATER